MQLCTSDEGCTRPMLQAGSPTIWTDRPMVIFLTIPPAIEGNADLSFEPVCANFAHGKQRQPAAARLAEPLPFSVAATGSEPASYVSASTSTATWRLLPFCCGSQQCKNYHSQCLLQQQFVASPSASADDRSWLGSELQS